ncbi:MAG: gephyrin-like molybdotransferase Glp [Bacteroidota bacterium]
MISLKDALDRVLANVPVTGTESIRLENCAGRVLAANVVSDVDMPPFNKSAVDGFACLKSDIGKELQVIETVPAGKIPENKVSPGICIKIMTGAMVPEGADFVAMVENSQPLNNGTIRLDAAPGGINICFTAEDVKNGDIVLEKGITVMPQHIAVMAAVGCTEPVVYKKPHITVLSTGDELVEPDCKPGLSQIRNSNASQLMAQVVQAGAEAVYGGIVSDDAEVTFQKISSAVNEFDIVILTGGVSMGDYDFVPDVMKRAGIEIIFHSIAIQPGKPTLFGRKGNKLVFGLPGNPVSSYIAFELIVRPAICRMIGKEYIPVQFNAPLSADFMRRNTSREAIVPVKFIEDGSVEPVSMHGSAHIHALTYANGLMIVPAGTALISKGEMVHVRSL